VIPKVQVRILRLFDFLFVFEILVGKVEAFFLIPGVCQCFMQMFQKHIHISIQIMFLLL